MNANETCSTCSYAGLTDYGDDQHGYAYECRRYAPRARVVAFTNQMVTDAVPRPLQANWPLVLPVDWCGEYVLQILPNEGEV